MKDFKKYITLNLISILGWLFGILILFIVFYLYPDAKTYDSTSAEDWASAQAGILVFCCGVLFIYALIEILGLFMFLVELLFYKLRKTEPRLIEIPDKFSRLHSILFILGLILSMFALTLGLCYLSLPV